MKKLKHNPDAGFSLLEVVVAILMIFFFTTTSLQMLVVSSLFKKKATQYTTAISLIQQDMERIKSAADTYLLTPALTNTSCNPANSASGMATYFMNALPTTTSGTAYSGYEAVGTYTPLKGQNYWLYRKETPDPNTPYSILQINYLVVATEPTITTAPNPTNLTPLATSYTEIIPNASLQCPSQ